VTVAPCCRRCGGLTELVRFERQQGGLRREWWCERCSRLITHTGVEERREAERAIRARQSLQPDPPPKGYRGGRRAALEARP
jgi:hypothetical protein